MKPLGALGILVVLFVLVSGCTNLPVQRSYTNAQYGFSLDPPVGWLVDDNTTEEVAVRFSSPTSENKTLTVSPPYNLDEGLALSIYADQLEENAPLLYEDFIRVSRGWLTMEGFSGYEIVYVYLFDNMTYEARQVALKRSHTVFLLTYSSPVEGYDSSLASVNQSIASFTL